VSKHTPRSRTYWRLREIVKHEEPNCWLCHAEIDRTLRYPAKMSFSVDHIIPASVRPDLAEVRSNLRAAHLDCNRRRQTSAPRTAMSGGLVIDVQDF
jgi:5-methylcytosine-specific restriction endonuclease McrA